MLPKGILFDLDDTIIAYTVVAEPTWRSICEEFSTKNNRLEANKLFSTIRDVSHWYWSDEKRHRIGRNDLNKARREVLEIVFERLTIPDRTLARKIADCFSIRREEKIYLFPGAKETLDYFKEKDISLALMTNGESEKQRNKIHRFGLDKYFSSILIEGEMGFGKPDDRVYIRALNELELEPEEVWAVGDNLDWDVYGPQKLGIFSIWNDYSGKGLPHESHIVPDRIINSIHDLRDSF